MNQVPMFSPQSTWIPPEMLPELTGVSRIAIDLETKDPGLKRSGPGWATGKGNIIGIAVATDHWSGYLPIAHEGGGNLDKRLVLDWLRPIMNMPMDKIFHNALYDVGWLKREGIETKGAIHDTMIAAPLLNEHGRGYSLNALGRVYCGEEKDETLLREAASAWNVDSKSEMYLLPAHYVGEYAEQDAVLTLKLWDVLQKEISEQELQPIYQLESSLLPLLIEMRWNGVRVDTLRAEELAHNLRKREKKCVQEIKRQYGVDVDIWAAASLAKAFNKAGVTYPRTEKTNAPSFRGDWLEKLKHPLAQLVVQARKYNKIYSTFIEGMILEHAHKGRLHGQMHPLRGDTGGTVSGRFSYSTPNLQQVPARDPELGPMVRGLFLPEEGNVWGAFDYSQQEPRLTVHYASRLNLEGAQQAVNEYNTADADFHQIVAEMAGISRKDAKTINLGLSYGMGKQKLIKQLNINDLEAEELFNNYHSRVPFIRELTNSCARRAENAGYVRTLLGRHCRFTLFEPRTEKTIPLPLEEAQEKYGNNLKRAYTYKALNRLIQGSAADMTKQAMVNLWREGIVPHVQVHDELDISVSSKKETDNIVDIMQECVQLRVPVKVDAELGTTWGKATVESTEFWRNNARNF